MAENINPAIAIWHAAAHAGEGPFPGSHEKLFTEAIEALEDQVAMRSRSMIITQQRLQAERIRANRYRRQRNGLAVILVTAAISGYIQYLEELKKPKTVNGEVVP